MRNRDALCLVSIVCVAMACSDAQDSTGNGGPAATGGGTAMGGSMTGGVGAVPTTGGMPATGGAPTGGMAPTGGVPATGGVVPTGGVPATGGVMPTGGMATGGVATGGAAQTGGAATGGAAQIGGDASGGVAETGGDASGGDNTGGQATGGEGAGGSGGCVKGQVAASEVIIMGESFYDWNPPYIQLTIEEHAKAAGAIGQNDSYRNMAIAGQPMSVVAGEYDTALQGGTVKVVIMDGGGIDAMSSTCSGCPGIFESLLQKMASNDVTDVIYTRYPEPGNPPGSMHPLKENLDDLMPRMEAVCSAATGLRCHWVDLRPVWENGDTTDGLHPTQSGGQHVGDLIWAKMVEECIAQ